MATTEINAEGVKNVIKELGYEIATEGADTFAIWGSSGIKIVCAVEEEILNVTVPLTTVSEGKVTREIALSMLRSENGLATSHIELVKLGETDNVSIVLMNYCKLQELGDDDRDDIETAIEFIELDTARAREILAALEE